MWGFDDSAKATRFTPPSKMARSIIEWHNASSGALKSELPHPRLFMVEFRCVDTPKKNKAAHKIGLFLLPNFQCVSISFLNNMLYQ